ncbi:MULTISPECIES: FAD-binding protein [unclassified Desulfovibrio]|uniref:FAD-binding protein n=1 Tax=unclassified Desulfovibrio TaxID=2593640 RepID=UPI0013EB2E14|nr:MULTISPECIES: FAD-binding protein [unclassified Desulfovibrio]
MSEFPTVFVIADSPEAFNELVPAAAALGAKTEAIYVGADEAAARRALALGAGRLHVSPARTGQIFEDHADTLAALVKGSGAALVLMRADKRGRAMAAKLGVKLGAAVVNDVSSIEEGVFGHMAYGGLAQAREKPGSPLVIATVAPGTFKAVEMESGDGAVEKLEFIEPKHPIRLRQSKARQASSADIGKAKRLVGVGRGFSKKEDISLAQKLADAIGAEIACSRPIAEGEQWLERERYIGVSGAMVKPDLYLAAGISGQVQHMVGVKDAKTIVVINKDKNAPIFRFADYGIVGDLYKILPALAKALG